MRGRRCPGCLMVRARGLGGAGVFAPNAGLLPPTRVTEPLLSSAPRLGHCTPRPCPVFLDRPWAGKRERRSCMHSSARSSHLHSSPGTPWVERRWSLMMLSRSSSSAPNPSRWRSSPPYDEARVPPNVPVRPDAEMMWPADRSRCPKRRVLARTSHSVKSKAPGHRMVSWRYLGRRGFNPLRFGHIRPGNPINRPRVRTGPPRRRRPMACGA